MTEQATRLSQGQGFSSICTDVTGQQCCLEWIHNQSEGQGKEEIEACCILNMSGILDAAWKGVLAYMDNQGRACAQWRVNIDWGVFSAR